MNRRSFTGIMVLGALLAALLYLWPTLEYARRERAQAWASIYKAGCGWCCRRKKTSPPAKTSSRRGA